MMIDNLGKKAETKIKEWLNHPENGCCFDRIPDQLSGFYGSKNICDFTLYKCPYFYYIESKATESDSFSFKMLSDNQREKMTEKSKIQGVYSIVIVLFACYKRAFIFRVSDIEESLNTTDNKKSLNIKHIDKWFIPSVEIPTISSRKELLDYEGELDYLVRILEERASNF